jgi:hypothetical protein
MTTNNNLIPSFIDLDFQTSNDNLKQLLGQNPVFKDIDYTGSNITTLVDLISYLISLNTYYMNIIAKNQFLPTSNLYETTHMLSQLGGYNPMGYRSSSLTLNIDINISASCLEVAELSASSAIIVPEWVEISNSMGLKNTDTDKIISFVNLTPTNRHSFVDIVTYGETNNTNIYTIELNAREGYIVRYDYKGSDLSNNRIYLPFNTYDYDDDINDDVETVIVYVNDNKWTRLSDWFDRSDEISEAYMFKYDKYGRYYIEFSETRTTPNIIDEITIISIVSSGENGDVAANIIDLPPADFLTVEDGTSLSTNCYTVYNPTSSIGGSGPETIDEIKSSTIGSLHSQYRNVTKTDYISHLNSRADIVQVNVWGEQENSPDGNPQDYNKVYISIVPSTWNDSTVSILPTAADPDTITTPISAVGYNEEYISNISDYLKPRKILTTYEEYVIPRLLFFKFKIGLKIKQNYTYTSVMNDVKRKLEYYFSEYNRTFNEKISFTDIIEYMLDTSINSPDDTFQNINGLRLIVIRDIDIVEYDETSEYVNVTIYEPNSDFNYPQYLEEETLNIDNKLRNIQLGNNQFPMLFITSDTFNLET